MSERNTRWLLAFGIAVLALAASATSLRNGFAYDDIPIIVENARVHSIAHLPALFTQSYWPPASGATLYRPLTMAVFTVAWTVGGGTPLVFHVLNVVLYIAVSLMVYALAGAILPRANAWGAAALYAVHPVHVEVTASCVGLSELLVALTTAGAVYLYLRAPTPVRPRDMLGIGALYAAGCLAKENAIVLPALLVVAELTIARRRPPLVMWTGLAVIAIAYLGVRVQFLGGVVGETPAITLGDASWPTRWWTMLGVVTEWVRLLIWPAHLAAMYSPPATPVRHGLDVTTAIGFVVLAGVATLAVCARRRWPAVAFGLAWAGLALAPISNVIVRSGVLLAERTLFLPSIGVLIAIGAVTVSIPTRYRVGLRSALAVVLLLAVWRSAIRAPVWRNNDVLFAASVADEPGSYVAHYAYAGLLFNEGHPGAGEHEGREAIALYPDDPRPQAALADVYAKDGHCDAAIVLAKSALALTPPPLLAQHVLAKCLSRTGR